MVKLGFLLSIFVEISQFILAFVSGFTLRYVDINDVLFNTLGSFCGFVLFLLFAYTFQKVIKTEKFEMNAVLRYVQIKTATESLSPYQETF